MSSPEPTPDIEFTGIEYEPALTNRLQENPNDSQAAKDMWLNRILESFTGMGSHCGFSVNTDELIASGLFVVDIVNSYTHQIRVVFAHPNYKGSDRSTPASRIWKSLLSKMTRYMLQVRRERLEYADLHNTRDDDLEEYYAVIAVGRSVRFFSLEPGTDELMDASGTNDAVYDAIDDKERIKELLGEFGLHASWAPW